MNKISVAILDEHNIILEGISELLNDVEDIEVKAKISDNNDLIKNIKTSVIHILILNIYNLTNEVLDLIRNFNTDFPKINILILSVESNEELVFKTIKAGAKGFLAKDTSRKELIEAIYTLRNGFDYYSKSITNILLNKYIDSIKTNSKSQRKKQLNNLSVREQEIMELWGNSYTNKEIADKLFISIRTVESHKNHIMQKLNMKTVVDLVKFAIKNNVIEI
jgi:DNA-binding NarL/FixJ family response regulator